MLLEKRGGEVLQVFNQRVVGLRPVHGEIKTVFIPLRGIGKVTGIGAVGYHKQLQVFKQRVIAVKAFLAVTVNLVKSFTNRYTAFFQLDLYQRQAIDQNGDIVAIGMRACLFKLLDDLHFIAKDVFLSSR